MKKIDDDLKAARNLRRKWPDIADDINENFDSIVNGGVNSVTGDSVDNTDPSNPIVNAPTEAPTDQTYVLQGDTWMPSSKSTGGIRMMWSDDTVLPPGPNEISADNADLSLVTELRISSTLSNGADIGALIVDDFEQGYTIYGVVDQKDTSYAGYTVTGEAVDNGTWFAVPVEAVTTGTTPIDGDALILGVIASTADKAYIILESTTTQALSIDQATPTVLNNWVVVKANGISLQGDSIRNDTGRVIQAMSGTIGLHPQVDGGGGNKLINLTSERSPDDVTYTINDQLRPIFTNNNAETYNTKESYLTDFQISEYVRFIAYADSAMSIAGSSAQFRNEAITGPAALWILCEA